MAHFNAKFTLDLSTASTRSFNQLLDDFEAWRATQEQRDLDLTNGWKTITPEIAEAMLLRNPIGANRRPTLSTVKYYARQMVANEWKKTGQSILFTSNGVLLDAGHRLWAGYLSGASFPTYVIGDVPPDTNLFAFIDNAKPRSAADALTTAGLNGLSKLIAAVVKITLHYEHGCYHASAKKTLDKLTPIEVIRYASDHENLRLGARLMAGEYKSASSVIVYKDVAAFAAYQIIEIHGEEVLDEFMTQLGDNKEPEEGSPISALQKVFADDATSREPLQKHQVLGHLIKGFNAWLADETVKKITLKVNETYPRFAAPRQQAEAAE